MRPHVIHDYGDRALLIECGSADEVLALAASIRATPPPGVTDIVPGARTVLVNLDEPAGQAPARARLAQIAPADPAAAHEAARVDVVIDVVYDGRDPPDLPCPAGANPGPGSRPVRWHWPESSAGSTRVTHPAAGSSSAAPTRRSGTSTGPSRRC
jgi:hypothetical protein